MSCYHYTPLPPDDDPVGGTTPGTRQFDHLFTRRLTIHKGNYGDDIEVDLEVVDLGDRTPSRPYYDALSYAWGSEEKPCAVFVDEDKRTIPTTTNLDEALRRLRYPDRPRYMWIDALCIDQGNEKERSRQVSYMSHVFWTAPRVVVWLGPGDEEGGSNLALETLEDIGNRIQVNWELGTLIGVTKLDNEQWGPNTRCLKPLNHKQHTAILALIQRPWFERIWIRQEVFKANDMSRVVCGRKVVGWGAFQRGVYCCVKHRPPPGISKRKRKTWRAKYQVVKGAIRPYPYVLTYLRHRTVGASCTDDRDRIYALLGMMNDEGKQLGIVPDYSKTASELYHDVAMRYITTYRSLDLLLSCGRFYPEALSSDASNPIPTWVPNWSVPGKCPVPLYLNRVFCPFQACTEYLGNGILRAAGVSNGTVQDVIELDTSAHKALAASIRALVPSDAIDTAYPGGGNLWDAFRITLCAEYFSDRTEPPHWEKLKTSSLSLSSQASKEAMRSVVAGEDLSEDNFLNLVKRWHRQGRFFTTREGYLGWGPKATDKGDQIVTFLGFDIPIMIRPSSNSLDGRYFEVIGSCYLHGFMHGEAFLGPLPDWIRPVRYIDKPALLRFHNTKTSDIAVEDPRLRNLPIDMGKLRRWRKRDYLWRYHIKPEIWRSRGVEVVDFDLV
ncbi:Heterokaryon incompatibility protein 6, OR allele [Cytospora mali]|uniref:Heterokaryon incompatibility protein 6, OR allele n=1 Tax=Cytospora mali TaxID=578113 RepID=A0A194VTB5_CYTMA|nr:Heterokaryon incompatibility protein 6, OR allele [Valsa mali]